MNARQRTIPKLRESMEMAGFNLLNILSPAYDYMPLWNIKIDRETKQARCKMDYPAHNIGRWWDAMLRLQAATGFAIPAALEKAMLENLEKCVANPLSICGLLLPLEHRPPGWADEHSQREILLALAGLVRWRGSQWAADQGEKLIRALDRYIQEDGHWNYAMMVDLAQKAGLQVDGNTPGQRERKGIRLTENHGRALEGVLEFYEATGSAAALGLADRLARFHLRVATRPDGSVPESDFLHTHSLFGTYRGLLMYGQLTRQHEYIDRVAATYAATVRTSVKQSGFISHDWELDTKGETASPGDAAQLALWLARLGYGEYLDDAERIVRCRILPSQITEPLGLAPMADDGRDEHANLDARTVGSFGGMHRHPHGEAWPTTDITAADLHTLCDVYQGIVDCTEAGLRVNFHFDYEDSRLRVASARDQRARLRISLKTAEALFIRIPGWTAAESVKLTIDEKPAATALIGRFLFVEKQEPGSRIHLSYELPEAITTETTDGVEYRMRWRGDEVVGISPNTDYLPFYPTMTGDQALRQAQ